MHSIYSFSFLLMANQNVDSRGECFYGSLVSSVFRIDKADSKKYTTRFFVLFFFVQ